MVQQEFTEQEYDKIMELLRLCKDYHMFQFDDLVIRGLRVKIIKQFIKEKPSMKFRTWLIDRGLVEKEL